MMVIYRRSLMALLVFMLCSCFDSDTSEAQTKVVIASNFNAIYPFDQAQTYRIQCYPFIMVGRAGDIVSLHLQSSRRTELQFALVEGDWPAACESVQPTFEPPGKLFQLTHDGPVVLVVSSGNWMPLTENRIQGVWQLSRTFTRDDRAALNDLLGSFANYVDARFITRPFTIWYRPCGTINAKTDLTTGDITLCSELFNNDISPRLQFAIFLHELGHSLLSGWGEHGGDRESECDDFAAALLIKEDYGIGAVEEMAKWFAENQNPWIDQFKEIAAGDPHPPNIQRANLLRGSLYGNVQQFVEGWNPTLYRHMRTEWLQQQVPIRNYESRELAAAELRRRLLERVTTPQPPWPPR